MAMKSVGEIFKKTRTEKKLTFEDVEKKIKIRAKFLKALEDNDYQKLPSTVYIKGFIRNYSEFLGLSSEKVLMVFRRQFDEKRSLGILPRGLTTSTGEGLFFIKKPPVMALFFLLPLLLLSIYLYREYRIFTQPPALSIQAPGEAMTISKDEIEVSGQTDPSAILTLNGQKIFLKADGSFTQQISLTPGLNTLEFIAKNKLGRETVVKRNIEVAP